MYLQAVMKHVWIKEKAPEGTDVPLEESMFANIKNFTRTNKLKKMTLHVIAQRLKDADITSTHVSTCICTCSCVYLYVYVYKYMCIHTYIYIYIY